MTQPDLPNDRDPEPWYWTALTILGVIALCLAAAWACGIFGCAEVKPGAVQVTPELVARLDTRVAAVGARIDEVAGNQTNNPQWTELLLALGLTALCAALVAILGYVFVWRRLAASRRKKAAEALAERAARKVYSAGQ